MKKIILFTLTLLFICNLICFAKIDKLYDYEIPVSISVNNQFIKTDQSGFIYNNLTYVPIRFVSRALNTDNIFWNDNEFSATITKDNKEIKLFVGENFAYVNGMKKEIEGSIILKNQRVFVPVRFISEEFMCDVSWDEEFYIVNLSNNNIEISANNIDRNTDYDSILWLARIIEAESGGEPFKGKIGVGNVIMNRVKSNEFPNTIYGVIFDKKHGVQFQPVMNNTIYKTPSRDSIVAAKLALNSHNTVGKSLYFLNPKIATNFWIVANRRFFINIKNHDFYL